jgi:hypothetical protein
MHGGDAKQAGEDLAAEVVQFPRRPRRELPEPGLGAKVLRALVLMWYGAGFAATAWWVSIRP